MTHFLLLPLFSLSTMSALAATPADKTGIAPADDPFGLTSPRFGRPRAVAGELAWLDAPHPSFGLAIAGVGDLDGDGLDDFAVGAPYQGDGAVYVYRGVGNSVSLWAVLQGDCAEGGFGAAIAGGDTNGDGYADLVIGSPGCGRVSVVHGSPYGLGAVALVLQGEGQLGASVAVGDLDLDGLADIVAGDPEHNERAGQALVQLSGGGGGQLAVGSVAGGRLGDSVAIVQDLNGDGSPEVAAGAPDSGAGTLTIVYDAALGRVSEDVRILEGAEEDDRFGAAFAGIGDVDGDGCDDLVVGSPGANGGKGELGLFRGCQNGVDGRPGMQVTLPDRVAFGRALAVVDSGAGGDYFVAAAWDETAFYGRFSLYAPGGASTLSGMASPQHSADGMGYGFAVAGAGDLSGDGMGELLVSQCFLACEGVTVLTMGVDSDADGVVDSEDCAPRDPAVSPVAFDLPDDGIDQDCDGFDDRSRVVGEEKSAPPSGACSALGGGSGSALMGLLGLLAARRRRGA